MTYAVLIKHIYIEFSMQCRLSKTLGYLSIELLSIELNWIELY